MIVIDKNEKAIGMGGLIKEKIGCCYCFFIEECAECYVMELTDSVVGVLS